MFIADSVSSFSFLFRRCADFVFYALLWMQMWIITNQLLLAFLQIVVSFVLFHL